MKIKLLKEVLISMLALSAFASAVEVESGKTYTEFDTMLSIVNKDFEHRKKLWAKMRYVCQSETGTISHLENGDILGVNHCKEYEPYGITEAVVEDQIDLVIFQARYGNSGGLPLKSEGVKQNQILLIAGYDSRGELRFGLCRVYEIGPQTVFRDGGRSLIWRNGAALVPIGGSLDPNSGFEKYSAYGGSSLPGDSGGPVINPLNGNVIGVIVGKSNDGLRKTFIEYYSREQSHKFERPDWKRDEERLAPKPAPIAKNSNPPKVETPPRQKVTPKKTRRSRSGEYKLVEGETLSHIYLDLGFKSLSELYRHPGNQHLEKKTKRIPTGQIIYHGNGKPKATTGTHIVVKGDTLWSIARKYGFKNPDELTAFGNNAKFRKDPKKLKIGAKLQYPAPSSSSSA